MVDKKKSEEDISGDIKGLMEKIEYFTIILDNLNKNSVKFVDKYKKFNDTSNDLREEIIRLQKENINIPDKISNAYKDSIAELNKINLLHEESIKHLSRYKQKMDDYVESIKNYTKKIDSFDEIQNSLSKKLNDQEVNISKLYFEMQEINKLIKEKSFKTNDDFQSRILTELKNISTKFLELSKKSNLKPNEIKESTFKSTKISAEIAEIKTLITEARNEIINAITSRTSTNKTEVIPKTKLDKKIKGSQLDKALSILRGEFSYINTDADLEDAVEEYIKNAREEISQGFVSYVSEESGLKIRKDGRNGRRAWRRNYYMIVTKIVIPLDNPEYDDIEPTLKIMFHGETIRDSKFVKLQSLRISELVDYALLVN